MLLTAEPSLQPYMPTFEFLNHTHYNGHRKKSNQNPYDIKHSVLKISSHISSHIVEQTPEWGGACCLWRSLLLLSSKSLSCEEINFSLVQSLRDQELLDFLRPKHPPS